MTPQTYLIRVTPVRDPDNVPVEVRLRRLLKAMLRGYRLRCVSIEEEPAPVGGERSTAPPPPGCDE